MNKLTVTLIATASRIMGFTGGKLTNFSRYELYQSEYSPTRSSIKQQAEFGFSMAANGLKKDRNEVRMTASLAGPSGP
jgi:hypothetical protein